MSLYPAPYDRTAAVTYAVTWALQNNPQFYDYSNVGGDCTNFASQVIYAGARIMDYTPVYGWYYKNPNDKAPSWTGVNFLYNFLVSNQRHGPFAAEVGITEIEPGDVIQLAFSGGTIFHHSLPITKIITPLRPENIYVSTHSPKKLNEKLSSYSWTSIRYLHIKGVYR